MSFFSQSRGKVSFWEFIRMVLPLCLSAFLLFSPTRAVLLAAGGEGEGEGGVRTRDVARARGIQLASSGGRGVQTRLRSRPVREKKKRRRGSSPGPAAQVVVVLVTLVVMGAIVINSRVAVFVPCSVALGQSPTGMLARPPPCPGLGGGSAGPTRENYRARAG